MRAKALFAAAILLAAAACAPVTLTVDNPKDGSTVELAKDQTVRFRFTNVGGGGAWERVDTPLTAVKQAAVEVQPPTAGALQLESFEFVGVQPGVDELTFVKRPDNHDPDAPVEGFTVRVAVK